MKELLTTPEARPAEPRRRERERKRRLCIVVALLFLLCAVGVATARLFVWPPQGMPAHVDAIVMLNGPGDRLDTALELAWEHRASTIVISRGSTYWGHGSVCAPPIPRIKVICFDPSPSTTRGEAEFAGRLAKRYGWHSMVVVAITPQDTPARLRVGRCFSGKIYFVNGRLRPVAWPALVAYEWGATIKALLQRGC